MGKTDDLIERSLKDIMDAHERTATKLRDLEARVEVAEEHAENAARSRGPATPSGDMAVSLVPDRFRRTIEMHERQGHARPVARAAAESALKLLAQVQLPGQNAPRAAQELAQMRAYLNESTGSQGAYSVPTFVEAELYRLIERSGVTRRLANVRPVSGKSSTLVNLASNVTTYVVRELGTNITQGEPTLGSAALDTWDYVAYGQATIDVLQDEVVGLLDFFFLNAAEQIARAEDQYLLEGTTAPCVGLGAQTTTNSYTIGKIIRIDTTSATNSPTTPTLAHLAKLVNAVPLGIDARPALVMRPETFANIISQVSSALPVIGGNVAWFTPNPNPSDAILRGSLLGHPVLVTDVISTATEGAKLYFGAFGRHAVIGDRAGIDFMVSPHEKFQAGLVAMRVIKRTALAIANANGFAYLGKCPYSLA